MATKQQVKGFTLIELIMVIVILGVLSAFALPRFADLGGNARTAAVEGARASAQSSSGVVRAQALVNPADAADGTITIEGQPISLVNGFLSAPSLVTMAQLGDFLVHYNDEVLADSTIAHVTSVGAVTGNPCFTFTNSAAANTPPVISPIQTWDDTVVGVFTAAGAAATGTCTP